MTADAAAVRRRPKDRKQQILVQARDLFVELGYPSVSMAMIAERLGITAGALYRHYATKADLLEAVVRDSFQTVARPAEGLGLAELIDREIAVVAGRPHMADLWSREVRYLPEPVRREIRAVLRETARAYLPGLRESRPELTGSQVELVAWAIQSVLSGLGRDSVRLPSVNGTALVRGAARALPAVVLSDNPAGPRPAAGLAPVSTRERLLIAARRQFSTVGYQEASMAGIGAEADVTRPNLYFYFDSKADLLRAVIARGTHALWLELDAALAGTTDPAVALAAAVASYVKLSRDWAGLRLDLVGDPGLTEEFRGIQREYVAEWVALLREIRPGLTAAEARALVQLTLTTVNDLPRIWHLAQQPSFDGWVTSIAAALLASGPEAAARP